MKQQNKKIWTYITYIGVVIGIIGGSFGVGHTVGSNEKHYLDDGEKDTLYLHDTVLLEDYATKERLLNELGELQTQDVQLLTEIKKLKKEIKKLSSQAKLSCSKDTVFKLETRTHTDTVFVLSRSIPSDTPIANRPEWDNYKYLAPVVNSQEVKSTEWWEYLLQIVSTAVVTWGVVELNK